MRMGWKHTHNTKPADIVRAYGGEEVETRTPDRISVRPPAVNGAQCHWEVIPNDPKSAREWVEANAPWLPKYDGPR